MNSYKILGQLDIASGGTHEVLYTCPLRTETKYNSSAIGTTTLASVLDTQTIVTSIIMSVGAARDTVSMYLLPLSTTTPAAKHFLMQLVQLEDATTYNYPMGLTLSAGNTITVTCATTGAVSFTAMGSEIT